MTVYKRFDQQGQLELLIAKARNRAHTQAMSRPKSLDHLPMAKRHELEFVVETLVEQFRKKIANRQSPKIRNAEILKIILFGSYSRDDWVEDPIGRYYSDFDLLIVTSNEEAADFPEYWADTEMLLMRELGEGKRLKTPVSLIVHSLDDVNEQLERGRYFFVDIVRDGIPLLAVPGHRFIEAKALPAEAALIEAQKYFDDTVSGVTPLLSHADSAIENGWNKDAAFQLHQAAERLYQGIMLVMTLHTPKSHNLTRLRQLAEPFDVRLREVWPSATKFEKRSFELLKQGYVNARYSEHYKVSREELAFMRERIEVLGSLVVEISQAQIKALKAASKQT